MNMTKTKDFPDKWGNDKLTEFIDVAITNVTATFYRDKNECPLLIEIDSIFQTIAEALDHPRNRMVESLLLYRTHSAFRASSILAMSGMNPEAFAQLRTCLENALYALHIYKNSGLNEVWLNRHTNEESLKAVKNKFKISDAKNTLKNTDSKNYAVASKLYDRTIDFGAHPNEMASTSGLILEEEGENIKLQPIYASGGNMQQRHAMKSSAQVGVCSLYILREIFKERFDILGLTARLDKLRTGL